ncbi:MAG: HD domain-containing protein [Clostridia bacterium]|nr:HD domain-containing protein [Clostridia bacterium]
MKKWKLTHFSLFILFCILLNYGGKLLAVRLSLPLWLDAFGTVLSAYVAGPVCGCIVGLTGNLIYALENRMSVIYSVTSITLGIIVGLAAKRKYLDRLFGAMSVSAMSAAAAILVSTPLNILFYHGSTGNKWGDGVIGFLKEQGCPDLLCYVTGQFYIDFLDKFLTLMLLFLVLRLIRRIRRKKEKSAGTHAAEKTAAAALALLLCCTAAGARGEEASVSGTDYSNYVQTVYAGKNGLPCGEANDIAQTNDGILWVGTYAGLYRYNGREFRWMDYESVRNVKCLYVDEESRLWIGTNDSGLSIAINEKIANVVDESRGLPSNTVRSIIQDINGYYYIGTTDSLQILTLNGGLKKVNTLREINYANHLAADPSGLVAAVTKNGRVFLIRKGRILSSLRNTGDHGNFRTCCFDPEGRLLVGTKENAVYVFDVSNEYFEQVGCMICEGLSNLNDMQCLENGDLFITADNGVGYVDASGTFHSVNTNDFDNSIDNMQVDYQGNFWFTSSRKGLLRMAPSTFRDVYATLGMTSQMVNAVEKWQGAYYFGTDKGLDAVDETCKKRVTNALTEQFAETPEHSAVRIRCLMADSKGSLWICTDGSGLIEVEEDGTQHVYDSSSGSLGDSARVAKELSDGTVLAAGDTGISFIRGHKVVRTIGRKEGLTNTVILTVTELPDKSILAGTDGDGIALIRRGNLARMIDREDGLTSGVILRTVWDPYSEGVFIVTSNSLCYMDKEGKISQLSNFPYFNNYDIWIKDEHTLFVMSSAGIYVVDREEVLSGADSISYKLLDSRQGLNSALTANSWNYFDGKENLFLPCDTGVFVINANQYISATKSCRLTVSTVRMDGEAYPIEKSAPIVAARSTSKIELYPEIINYTIQDPYVGFYLEGFEDGWIVLPQNSVSAIVYTNVPPGKYLFHLAVFDHNQQDILGERTYELIKEEEIYDNPWFIFYLLIVPIIFIAWFTWFLVRRQMQRALEKQEKELALVRQQVQMGNETIFAIAKAVDAKDVRTAEHSRRVSEYSVMIAREVGLSEEECESLRKAARMHDIGKIGVPDSILNKPARLTDEEYAKMKTHTTKGAEILKDFTLIDHVVEGARFHHERYDGRGYPDGLKGEEIPLFGRIIGVADTFDAMTANRVYRKQMDFDYVLNELKKGRGTQFDPRFVDALLKLIEDGKINIHEIYGVQNEEAPKDEAAPQDAAAQKADGNADGAQEGKA